jgi:hypothetical protein
VEEGAVENDENGVEPAGAPNGAAAGVAFIDAPVGPASGEVVDENRDASGVGSLPIFFSQPRMAGSLLLTQVISIPFMSTREEEDVEEAVTDA